MSVVAYHRRGSQLAFVGDGEVMRALGHMLHKMPLDGGKASLCEHVVLFVPGGMDRPPAHLTILIVDPGPEEWLPKFFQGVRIGEVQIQQDPGLFQGAVAGTEERRAHRHGDLMKDARDQDSIKGSLIRHILGRHALYVDAKVVALVCDNQLFVKDTEAGRALLRSPREGPPYPGAKPHIIADEYLDDVDLISSLISTTAAALPATKPKKKRGTR